MTVKKLLALLLTLILCISASVTVFAAGPSISASDVEAERGDIVYVAIELSDCVDANTLAVEFDYDTDVLKKLVAKCTWTNEAELSDFDISQNRGNWYVEDATDLNGEICKLAFQVTENAAIADTTVSCKVIVKNEGNKIGEYTTEATVSVVCSHVAKEGEVGVKVDDTNHKYTCANCGTDILEEHIWDNGKVTKVATETETGVKTYTCTFCKATKEEVIPKVEVEDDDDDQGSSGDEDDTDTPGTGGSGNQGGTTTPPAGDSGNQGGTTTPPAGDSGNQGGTTTPETNKPETNKPDSSKPGTTTPPSGDSGNQGGTTTPDTEDVPAVEIKDTVVKEKVDEIQKAEEGKDVVIEMKQENGKVATVVPVEILDAVKGKDVDVVLNMGEYSWTINGKDVKDGAKDINLEVVLDTKAVDETVVKELAGNDTARQISLSHDGEFNFKATLTINVGKDFVGKFGNLYYHEGEGKFTFVSAAKVDENGNVNLDFSHASDYVVVLGEDRSDDENTNQGTTTPDDENNSQKPGDDKPVDDGKDDGGINAGAIFTVILIIGAIAGAAYYFIKKK